MNHGFLQTGKSITRSVQGEEGTLTVLNAAS